MTVFDRGMQVAGQYLEFLVSQERFEEAAALMPRLLKVPFARIQCQVALANLCMGPFRAAFQPLVATSCTFCADQFL